MLQKCWEEESLILHVAMLSSFIWRSKILGCLFNPTVSWCKGLSSKMTLLTEIYPQLTRGRRRKSPAIWPRIPLETHLSELSQMLLNSQPQGLEGCCHDISAAVMLSEITFYSNGSHKANEPEPNYLQTHTSLWIYYFPTVSSYFLRILYQFHWATGWKWKRTEIERWNTASLLVRFSHLFLPGTHVGESLSSCMNSGWCFINSCWDQKTKRKLPSCSQCVLPTAFTWLWVRKSK